MFIGPACLGYVVLSCNVSENGMCRTLDLDLIVGLPGLMGSPIAESNPISEWCRFMSISGHASSAIATSVIA